MLKTLLNWFRPPNFPQDEDKTRRAMLLNVVLDTFLVTFLILFAGVLIGQNARFERVLVIIGMIWLITLASKILMHSGRVTTAGALMVGTLYAGVTLALANIGTIRAPATAFYLLTIVMSGLIMDRGSIVWVTILSTFTVIALLLAEANGLLPQPSLTITITQAVTFSVAFSITGVLLYLAAKSIDQALASAHREINERKRTEAELEKHLTELNQRNSELVQFTYTVSHDLRNPLVTIKGFLGMLDKDLRDGRPEKVQEDFKRIAGATDKMDILLSELLELSRIGRIANAPEAIDLVQLAREAAESVDDRLRLKNATVTIAPDLPTVTGDRLRLREVFEHLIDNAAKNTGTQPNPRIEIGTERRNRDQIIYVRDNGLGIEPQYHTKIFGLFEKLDPAMEGTGIGLALIKRIIEVHGGRVWVESEGIGRGSTFCFTISEKGV